MIHSPLHSFRIGKTREDVDIVIFFINIQTVTFYGFQITPPNLSQIC